MNYLSAAILTLAVLTSTSQANDLVNKGQYIFHLSNCYGCHTDIENDGQALAGGRVMDTQFGTFFTPNITPDKQTGIGNWTDQQFSQAVRSGQAPDGTHYYPTFPYSAYKNMTDADIKALKAYIFSLKPVTQKNKQHQLQWYMSRLSLPLWNTINRYLQNGHRTISSRGSYLVDTLGHCNECHTPRNQLGLLQMDRKFLGNKQLSAPDISTEGLNGWNNTELAELFSEGVLPDGDYVSDHMAEVIEFSSSRWKAKDLKAVIHYLRKN